MHGVVIVDGGERLRVVGWGYGGLFPTCTAGVIYFLNNIVLICPISLVGWCVVIQ